MKTTISDLVIAFFDLVEAEGRTLRQATMRVGVGLSCVIIAMLIGIAAVAFFLWGVYQLILVWVSPPLAALLMALLALVLAMITLGVAKWLTR
jgi:hypothetical protein